MRQPILPTITNQPYGVNVRIAALVLAGAYFASNLVRILAAPGKISVLRMADFAFIAPFYLPISHFVMHLNWATFLVLYIVSSIFYLLAINHLSKWGSKVEEKIKNRPKFELRQM